MKKLPFIISGLILVALCACHHNNLWNDYEEWRIANNQWYNEQASKKGDYGEPYYRLVQPAWYPTSGVLIKYFNDRNQTENNLSPMLTSYVDVKYKGVLYNDVAFDSSYANTADGDSIYRVKVSDMIPGWQLVLCDMHVGDSCETIIPYGQGYGDVQQGIIPPYSALKFNIKLVDIYRYESEPNE